MQHCSWVLRALRLPIDNWCFDLRAAAPGGDISLIRTCDVDQVTTPILHNLVSSYEHFYGEFSKKDGNYKEVYLFCNTAFIREANSVNLLDEEFFGFNSRCSLPLSKLKYCDCFTNEHLKNLNQFLQMGIVLTPATWFWLQSALRLARNRLRKTTNPKTFRKILVTSCLE